MVRPPCTSGFVELENDGMRVTVDLDAGGEVNSIVAKPSDTEVLWRDTSDRLSPFTDCGGTSEDLFYDTYRGGMQELFPNTGPETVVDGARLPFHGEASRLRWAGEHVDDPSGQELRATVTLRRYPVRMTRTFRLDHGDGALVVTSTAENLSSRSLAYSWGVHPVFAPAVTEGASRLYGIFTAAYAHPTTFAPQQSFPAASTLPMGVNAETNFLELLTGREQTSDLCYADCSEGWFALRNESTGLTVTVSWPLDNFGHLWIWQECQGAGAFPWWGRHHIVGIEPHSDVPAIPLGDRVADGSAKLLGGREVLTSVLTVHVGLADLDTVPTGVADGGRPLYRESHNS